VTAHATTAGALPKRKGKPPRLARVFQKYEPTLYFLTFNTHLRRHFLTSPAVHDGFVRYCQRAGQYDIGVGRYVIMPDHIHLFACFGIGDTLTLGEWIKGLKRCLDAPLITSGLKPSFLPRQRLRSFWQPGFHDHVLRNDESHGEKWHYVRENPVRPGQVLNAHDWPYAGEIVIIDRV
jgi:putative transposase